MQVQNVSAIARHEFIDHGSLGTCNSRCVSLKSIADISRLETLSQRLARLEESSNKEAIYFPARNYATSTTSSSPSGNLTSNTEVLNDNQKRYRAYEPHDTAALQAPPSKHRKSQSVAHQAHSPGSTHHASEAREYIEHELQCNPALSKDRRTALESARKFVSQLSNPTLYWEETAAMPDMDVQETIQPPTLTPELLYMMLPGKFREWVRCQ